MGQNPCHKAACNAVRGNVALKQIAAVHAERKVDVQAAACLIRQGLGQEACVDAVAHGNSPHDLLEHHHIVGCFQGAGVVAVDLILTVAALVMAVLGAHAHLLHGQADVAADVFACVQRGHVKVAAEVDGDAGGAAPVVVLEQIELALGTHVAGEAQLFELAVHAAQKTAAVAAEGRAVRLFHIAEELHHPALGGPPGQDGHGGKIGPEHKIALLHLHKTGNGAAVKADTILHGLGQVAGKHGDVFLGAKDIAEGKADEFDVVVLHKIKDVLLGIIAHSGSLRAAGRGEWHISAKLEKSACVLKKRLKACFVCAKQVFRLV